MKNITKFTAIALIAALTACGGDEPSPYPPHSRPGNGNGNGNGYVGTNGLDETVYTYDEAVIRNPERGWYRRARNANFHSNGVIPNPLSEEWVREVCDGGVTLIHIYYLLYGFIDKPLSQDMLTVFEADMNAIRAGGAKAIPRFAYSWDYDIANDRPLPNQDPPLGIVKGHIEQLKPLFHQHGDVIFALEAGIIGAYGEWIYTDNYNFKPRTEADYKPRRRVMDLLLDAVPKDRMICVRFPTAKLKMYGMSPADSVNLAIAFDQSDISRIGVHNDGFLADHADGARFESDNERDYWYKESRYLIMGGETCQYNFSYGNQGYSACANSVDKMEKNHLTYLNDGFYKPVLDGWVTGGCHAEIDRRMGYRLSLTKSYFTENPTVDEPLEIVLFIESNGFAGPMNPRDMEIVFVEKDSGAAPVRVKTDIDPRYWFAGQTHKVSLRLSMSQFERGKTYEVWLNLPDPKPTLNERPEYSIRLANRDIWDETTGYNKLREITLQ